MQIKLNETTQVVLSWLESQGFTVRLVGASARQALCPTLTTGTIEVLIQGVENGKTLSYESLPDGIDRQQLVLYWQRDQSLHQWLHHRGITVDAIAVDPAGHVDDPYGGVAHLESQEIQGVIEPDRLFRENPLALFAVARVLATTNWQASRQFQRMAYRDSGNVLDVQSESLVWGQSLNVVLLSPHLISALDWFEQTRVLAYTMPEIASMIGFHKSCAVHHKDLWDHTKIVTNRATPNLVVRWAALCHDIGKIWTRTVDKGGKVHFFRHEDHGALLFESIAHRMRLDDELTERTSYLIKNHSRVNLYREDWTDSAVRRLIRQNEGRLVELLAFSEADYTTKRQDRIREMKRLLSDIRARIEKISREDAKQPILNKGIGSAIMKCFHLAPSRTVGDLKILLEKSIGDGALPERAEDAVYLEWLTQDPQAVARIVEAGGVIHA